MSDYSRFSVSRVVGFTMIEFVVTLTVMGILIALSVPTFTSIVGNMTIRGAAESMLGGLQMARIEAVKRNQNVTFAITDVQGGAWLVSDVGGGVINQKAVSETRGAVIETPNMNVTFDRLGRRQDPPAADGVLTLVVARGGNGSNACEDGTPDESRIYRCMNVTIEPGGQVRMCDPQRPPGDAQAC